MIDFSKAFYSQISAQDFQNTINDGGVKQWMTDSSYLPTEFVSKKALLKNTDPGDFYSYAMDDLRRFSQSSVESYIAAHTCTLNGKSTAWACIALYYCAFYAAQFLTRVAGFHSSYLDKKFILKLGKIADLYGVDWSTIDAGQFLLSSTKVKHTENNADLTNYVGKLGSHQYFWRLFHDTLKFLEDYSTNENTLWSTDFITDSGRLMKILKYESSGQYHWLSSVRNNVNYQHAWDAWFPVPSSSKLKSVFRESIVKSPSQYRLDLSMKKQPELAFVNSCKFIFSIMIEVANSCSEFDKRNGRFGGEWMRVKKHFKAVMEADLP